MRAGRCLEQLLLFPFFGVDVRQRLGEVRRVVKEVKRRAKRLKRRGKKAHAECVHFYKKLRFQLLDFLHADTESRIGIATAHAYQKPNFSLHSLFSVYHFANKIQSASIVWFAVDAPNKKVKKEKKRQSRKQAPTTKKPDTLGLAAFFLHLLFSCCV